MEAVYLPQPNAVSFDGEEEWSEDEYEIYLVLIEELENDLE
jgi:hypothetical protein